MKNTMQNRRLFFHLVSFTALLIVTSSFSQRDQNLREFKIVIESIKGGLKLTGLKGTAFKELSFTLWENSPQGINEFGMTMEETDNSSDNSLADFEFTIEDTDSEYVLVGKKGTAWTKLSFSLSENNRAIVDQAGVAVK